MERLATHAALALDEFFSRCRAAEAHRAQEHGAAVVLQASWRGCLQRMELERLRSVAVTIQRCWRGHLGRRRFAAALAARNAQLRKAYFDHHATVIQMCWRGHFSRGHVHDFGRRRTFLASVAAANAAARAAGAAARDAALQHQQQQAHAAAKQQFEARVSRLHHLASTASIPGIFSPAPQTPAARAAAAVGNIATDGCVVAGLTIEQHLRAASRQQASCATKQQQVALRRAMAAGCVLPAVGKAPQTALPRCPPPPAAASASGGQAQLQEQQQQTPAGHAHACLLLPPLLPPTHPIKLAHRLVEAAVDDAFAARAAPNMSDGSFNPRLSLQQSTDFEAQREAAGLQRRLERGLMLVMRDARPFIPLGTPARGKQQQQQQQQQQHDPQRPPHTLDEPGGEQGAAAAVTPQNCGVGGSPAQHKHQWLNNTVTSGTFSKHLKLAY